MTAAPPQHAATPLDVPWSNVALAALDTAERLRDNPPEIPVLFREEGSLPEFIAGLRRLVRRDEEEPDSM